MYWGGSADDMIFTGCHFDNNTPEGTNRLVAFGGRGNHTFDNCTFKNNTAQGIADTDGIQIYKDDKNAPKVKFSEKIIKNFNLKDAQITISHDGGFAIAAAILQKAD